MDGIREYESDRENSELPEYDIKCEALLPLLRNETTAYFHCHRADDIFTALRISKEFGIKPVLIHATEGHLIADILGREECNRNSRSYIMRQMQTGNEVP